MSTRILQFVLVANHRTLMTTDRCTSCPLFVVNPLDPIPQSEIPSLKFRPLLFELCSFELFPSPPLSVPLSLRGKSPPYQALQKNLRNLTKNRLCPPNPVCLFIPRLAHKFFRRKSLGIGRTGSCGCTNSSLPSELRHATQPLPTTRSRGFALNRRALRLG